MIYRKASAVFWMLAMLGMIASCTRSPTPDNPFEGNGPPDKDKEAVIDTLDPLNFAGIHQQIFAPTCANSGCHDGAFEPDFRTIESSYNTLVYQPVIKNNPQGDFTYRVEPGNPDLSVLVQRLIGDIDGQSGMMPLVVDSGSTWFDERATHIANIKTWIANGAPDMFGNMPVKGDLPPSAVGAIAYIVGVDTVLGRIGQTGPIKVPFSASQIEIWVALEDDKLNPPDLVDPRVRFSLKLNEFDGIAFQNLTVAGPKTALDILGNPVPYYHKVVIDPKQWSPGSTVFFRLYVKDSAAKPDTEIPAYGSLDYIKEYFAITIN